MVNTQIPKNYTASPSSFTDTPHLTINREATLDLDSSSSFEGPEKLLEVWFAPSAGSLPVCADPQGLKTVTVAEWTDMLDLVHCKVLSIVESEQVDAYLLSESSMFVFPHKLVLKTCGTTTLLSGLPRMLEIAALSARFPHVAADPEKSIAAAASTYRVFYSRKNYLYPDQQRGPHRSWRDEVRALDRLFHNGSAYMIGKMNGEHWYLYLTEPDSRLTPPPTPDYEKFGRSVTETRLLQVPGQFQDGEMIKDPPQASGQDETLEVLMTDLDEENSKQFYLEHACVLAEGQFYQKYHNEQQNREASLKVSTERANGHALLAKDIDLEIQQSEDFDVFEQTSSDHNALASDKQNIALPEELTTEGHALGTVVSNACGLSDVYPKAKYPDARVDAYLFTPCGFSANGVIPAPMESSLNTTHYFTVHVTPEPQCSYASFETNVPGKQSGRETAEIVEQVVSIFKPGRFTVTLFETKPEVMQYAASRPVTKVSRMDHIAGYRRVDRIVHDLDGYDLVFRYYERHDWKGGAPRLGENY